MPSHLLRTGAKPLGKTETAPPRVFRYLTVPKDDRERPFLGRFSLVASEPRQRPPPTSAMTLMLSTTATEHQRHHSRRGPGRVSVSYPTPPVGTETRDMGRFLTE